MAEPIPLHPQPTIPNPLALSPWAQMSDQEIEEGIERAGFRIDAAEHTRQSLSSERARRAALRAAAETTKSENGSAES